MSCCFVLCGTTWGHCCFVRLPTSSDGHSALLTCASSSLCLVSPIQFLLPWLVRDCHGSNGYIGNFGGFGHPSGGPAPGRSQPGGRSSMYPMGRRASSPAALCSVHNLLTLWFSQHLRCSCGAGWKRMPSPQILAVHIMAPTARGMRRPCVPSHSSARIAWQTPC